MTRHIFRKVTRGGYFELARTGIAHGLHRGLGPDIDDIETHAVMSCNIIPGGDFICHKIKNLARARRARREVPIL